MKQKLWTRVSTSQSRPPIAECLFPIKVDFGFLLPAGSYIMTIGWLGD